MKLTLLGTGGPRPDPDRMGPAALVEVDGQRLLFDAGRGVCTQLARLGIGPDEVNPVFITHHHYDHICALDDVLLSAWNNGGTGPFEVFGPKGTERIVGALLNDVYAADIAFRMHEEHWLKDLRELVRARDVGPGLVHEAAGLRVLAEDVDHGHGLGMARETWPCLGYRIEAEGKAIAISGDAVDCEGLRRLAEGADVLLMCCYLAAAEVDDRTEDLCRYTIACSGEVGKIAARAGVGKLVLTHFRQKSDEMLRMVEVDARRDYAGPIVLGQDLMAIDV